MNGLTHSYAAFSPHKAILSRKEDVLLSTAIGCTSANLVNLYPPGDIVLCAGEEITTTHIRLITDALNAAEDVLGLTQIHPPMVSVVKRPDYKILTRDPQTLSVQEIKAYCNLFRESFYNAPYNQLAFNIQKKDGWQTPLSASEAIYGRTPTKHDYVDIGTIDNFKLPDHLAFYMDKDETEKVLTERFKDPGYMALLYETATGQLKGFLHTRVVTLRRVWETEEFKLPLILAAEKFKKSVVADETRFFTRVEAEFGLKPDSKILSVSGQAIHPDVRGKDGWFGKIMKAASDQVSFADSKLPMLTEISSHGSSRVLNSAIAIKVCKGILENGNLLAFAPTASHTLRVYDDPERLTQAIRHQIKMERHNDL